MDGKLVGGQGLKLEGVWDSDIGERLGEGIGAGSTHESSGNEWSDRQIVEGVGDGGMHGTAQSEPSAEGWLVRVLLR